MTRKQDHRIENGFAIFGMTLIEIVMLVSIWRTNWHELVVNFIFLIIMIDSFQLRKKLFNMKEAAIGLFNIINPLQGIGDSDRAEFAVVEENGQRRIDITLTRALDQVKISVSREPKPNKEKDNGQV